MRKFTPEYIIDKIGKYDAEELTHNILKLVAEMKRFSSEWTTQEDKNVWGW